MKAQLMEGKARNVIDRSLLVLLLDSLPSPGGPANITI